MQRIRLAAEAARFAVLATLTLSTAAAQRAPSQTIVTGRVTAAETGAPIDGALVRLEGQTLIALSDSLGYYRITSTSGGAHVLDVRRLGYAPARIPVQLREGFTTRVDVQLAQASLRLETVRVTADAVGRARGELGTADVIGRDAIANQSATSLIGILELIPNVPLSAPGLDGVQQVTLRTVPNSSGGAGGASAAADLASFGTLIVLDGSPLSNNANLQSTGPRGELTVSSSAGGGVDLRTIPASTLERVEVIRGIPSARYGDLTQGVIVVDTRAGAFEPDVAARYDPQTAEASAAGGWALGERHAISATTNVARTNTSPGLREDRVWRATAQLAHRFQAGRIVGNEEPRFTLDSRIDFTQLYSNTPENPAFIPGHARSTRDNRFRLGERARLKLGGTRQLELTLSLDRTGQNSFVQSGLLRGGTPFTDRLTEGRSTGRFVIGQYLSRITLDGAPYGFYTRLEGSGTAEGFGLQHRLRTGFELRREWNAGAGYQFDIEFPPQVAFNGVQGYDRPRRYDDIPAMATTAAYIDDRIRVALSERRALDLQIGVRVDALHDGGHWASAVRDAVVQPRLNAMLSATPSLRIRAGYGHTAKYPTLSSLYPAPQFFDVVNVNWFANDPAERLAVLTTFIRDPANSELGISTGRKIEAGLEIDLGGRSAIALTAYRDRITRAVGTQPQPVFITRDHYDLSDSTIGTGQPPTIIEPPSFTDTVPVLLDRPSNAQTLEARGLELTASFPVIPRLRTRLELNGAWVASRFDADALVFGGGTAFSDLQLNPAVQRAPYYRTGTGTGERAMLTYRAVHHQPELGFVATFTVQHTVYESRRDEGATDTLAFEGYITRDARLVPVPFEERTQPQYADLRRPRTGLLITSMPAAADWLLSFQVAKVIGDDGRLSVYAFNAFDRPGQPAVVGRTPRPYPNVRYGVELTLPLRWPSR